MSCQNLAETKHVSPDNWDSFSEARLNAFTILRKLGHSNVVSPQKYVDLAGSELRTKDKKCEEAIAY